MDSKKLKKVVEQRNCAGCGACTVYSNGSARMIRTKFGPVPSLAQSNFSKEALEVCPGIGINYPKLYTDHYGSYPDNWLHGVLKSVRIGYSGLSNLRRKGASGGITTTTAMYLLSESKVDAVICVQQGIPEPLEASYIFARSEMQLRNAMQSVYIPVSILDSLNEFIDGEKYAMVCLPEQAAALRKMQSLGNEKALQVKYVIGPYTGTALYPAAIQAFLRSKRVAKKDAVTSLKWREGEWPGYLEIKTQSGKVLQSKKVYYNFLIPFFVTHTSLRSMDFVNEFADLAVGDAWSPKYESEGKGFSVFVTRSAEMERIILEMIEKGYIEAEDAPKESAISMHGHMLDFKKRGGYLRNQRRKRWGNSAPDYGYAPIGISFSRRLTELVVSSIFLFAGNRVSRWLMILIPENIIGPFFDFMRLRWKKLSKPSKRKGLSNFEIKIKP